MALIQEYTQEFEPRIKKIAGIILIAIVCIFLRLYYLQGIRGNFYHLFSEENSIRDIPIPALRGAISDRHGISLVDNRAAFDLVLVPQYVVDADRVFKTLQFHLGLSPEWIRTQWEKRKKQPAFQPIVLLKDVPMDVASFVKARKNPWGALKEDIDLRGVDIRLRYEREYPDGEIASHVLGTVREIDPERLKKEQQQYGSLYQKGDIVGVSGLEEVWDKDLRGEEGYSQKVVNAVGREIYYEGIEEELIQKTATNGKPLQLTLDTRLHKTASDFFRGKKGAAVALDPRTGEVLLLFSAPTFNLSDLGRDEKGDYWRHVLTHPSHILLNRAIQGGYPPGSTYKMVTAVGGLMEKVIRPGDVFYCHGGLEFGGRTFGCWKKEGHGAVSFYRSLVASCDVYYYQVGLKLGVDRLAKYAKAFGLGEKTGIELKNERSGLIPTAAWKEKVTRQPWQEGETLSVAIGQGYNLVTPMQAAVMIAAIANGGKIVHPTLVKNRPAVSSPLASSRETVVLSQEILETVRKALIGVVSDPEGTAHRLEALKIPMGGKTGTAQVISLGARCSGQSCEDHAWFVAFAPATHPVIAMAVVVENGGHGSTAAAPLAGELAKVYLGEIR